MKTRTICDGVEFLGAVDWKRRLFDALIPLPDGTSYNSYLVRGSRKDRPARHRRTRPKSHVLMAATRGRAAGGLPRRPPRASRTTPAPSPSSSKSIPPPRSSPTPSARTCSSICSTFPPTASASSPTARRSTSAAERSNSSITPWVHWPETMCTYLREDADSLLLRLLRRAPGHVRPDCHRPAVRLEAAKRYYAEIMMPFRQPIRRNLEKVQQLEIRMIAPSHGPVYDQPGFILDAYRDWASDAVKNEVVLPYVSMHGSTQKMVEAFTDCARGPRHQGAPLRLDRHRPRQAGHRAAWTPPRWSSPRPRCTSRRTRSRSTPPMSPTPCGPSSAMPRFIGSYGWSTQAAEQVAG